MKGLGRPNISSNSRLFEKRGDPWVSEKEGQERFGRNLNSENPDFDQYFANRASEKEKYQDPRGSPIVADEHRLKAAAVYKMHKDMREHSGRFVKVTGHATPFRPCFGCRKAICIKRSQCSK
jgi:hypothetical protein